MIGAAQVMAWKTATIFGEKGLINRGLNHVGDSFKGLETPHMSKAVDGFGHVANMAVGAGTVAAPIIAAALPSADAKIQQKMHNDNHRDRQMAAGRTAPAV